MTKKKELARSVTIIDMQGASTLVEYLDGDENLQRKFVPSSLVVGNIVAEEVLQRGIPFGLPFEDAFVGFDAKQFANEMHKAGLWTASDVQRTPKVVSGVLRKIVEQNLKAIMESALQDRKRR